MSQRNSDKDMQRWTEEAERYQREQAREQARALELERGNDDPSEPPPSKRSPRNLLAALAISTMSGGVGGAGSVWLMPDVRERLEGVTLNAQRINSLEKEYDRRVGGLEGRVADFERSIRVLEAERDSLRRENRRLREEP